MKKTEENKKLSKKEMIKVLEEDIRKLEIAYHQKTGALACLKEIE
tara:strand:+ start:116 stop:250 length:135 start_codon:yes stop_codon:yes gene_type:complete